jgi:hypothetical protein
MLRLEGLARMEGLRRDAPAIRISSATQALIDSKAAENEVLKRDGSVSLSADWDVGEDRKILFGSDAFMHRDGVGNLTFADAVAGQRTLKNVGCPAYILIKAPAQPEGDLHLSDAATWAVSKALIKVVRVVTSSTDWDLYLLQNDNGHSVNDGNIPEIQIMEAGNGNANILLNLPYEDEDGSDEVHMHYSDNSGANTADIYIIGYQMV